MLVAGETPIDPTATVLRAPLKAISVPAIMAKVAQSPRSIADTVKLSANVGKADGIAVGCPLGVELG
jgi:hypothetical protein